MLKYSKKGLEQRKQERECLKEFFKKHVTLIKEQKTKCAECGQQLLGDVSEVAHRLPKSTFKSVQCDDNNVTYLCSWKSTNNCHSLYDGTNEQLQSLKIFITEQQEIKNILTKITEKYNYKLTDRWKID